MSARTTWRECLWVAVLLALLAGSVGLARAQDAGESEAPPSEAGAPLIEEATVETAPPPGPHTVYVYDADTFSVVNKVFVVDGDRGAVVGMVDAGWLANIVLAPDRSRFYLAETYYSRIARGERDDVITAYSSEQLLPVAEIDIPEGRMLVNPKVHNAGITPDGRYLLVFNMDPATSVSITDLQEGKFLQKVDTPGCFYVFPSAPNRFSMQCANGSLLTVTFDGQGNVETAQSPAFHASDEYLFDNRALVDGHLYAVSYDGDVYPVDLTGARPQFGEAWSLLTPEDREAGWRPGGWQVVAFHKASGRLYVLMHRGEAWTHKQAGTEVWVFDAQSRKRVDRLLLADPADSIAVSQDDHPQLYALTTHDGLLQIYDGTSGRLLHMVDELGRSPQVLAVSSPQRGGEGL